MNKQTKQKVADWWKIIYSNWKEIQKNFTENWETVKTQPRVEIHIPSLSYTSYQRIKMEKFV